MGELTSVISLMICRFDRLFLLAEPVFLLLLRLPSILQISLANQLNFLLLVFDFLIFILLFAQQEGRVLLQSSIDVLHALDEYMEFIILCNDQFFGHFQTRKLTINVSIRQLEQEAVMADQLID